jgi:hypothetical protein
MHDFRPHTDSGAGAGQSTSLIVGLGNYAGGELVVEGVEKDIRYKAIEFNGWTQRHWTMPFQGEQEQLGTGSPQKDVKGFRGIDPGLTIIYAVVHDDFISAFVCRAANSTSGTILQVPVLQVAGPCILCGVWWVDG